MKRRTFTYAAVALTAGLLLAGWSSRPAAIVLQSASPSLPEDLDAYIAASEADANKRYGLVGGTEKRIRWFAERGKPTALSVVYLHGFSATRQEIAPVTEMLADRLQANLFETRLTAHGRQRDRLRDVSAESWLEDTLEALEVGRRIGNRMLVLGTSTGATLALAAANHSLMQHVEAMVLMSPNLVLRDRASEVMTWPGGPLVARLVIGESRSWEPKNELQERYWTTTYPTATVVEVVRLMKFARNSMPTNSDIHILTITSENDTVVDPNGARDWIGRIQAPRNEHLDFPYSDDPGQHVLAGDILSPESNEALLEAILAFLEV